MLLPTFSLVLIRVQRRTSVFMETSFVRCHGSATEADASADFQLALDTDPTACERLHRTSFIRSKWNSLGSGHYTAALKLPERSRDRNRLTRSSHSIHCTVIRI